jgi:hypothetical protein
VKNIFSHFLDSSSAPHHDTIARAQRAASQQQAHYNMSASLNVIALVSGGKDSFFSILHCLANGHRLVALANLHPPEGGDEDINSFMYQTVGASLIETTTNRRMTKPKTWFRF